MGKREQDVFTGGTHNDCPSGKLAYRTRRDAHTRAIQMRKEGQHMRPYLCDRGCGRWHVGHVRPEVIAGEISADAWYAKPQYITRRRRSA